eukprot:TRINITY_DN22338_c0_g1_i1.p1 TRINITY_DN22338_c0_g1~~TRINITY_DN22338_c0_g1_i1.p1  ORF type:complete len:563 (+),score=90.38 TRINITY_DN22338_c0_g1_i1:80-1690(+)
MEADMPIASAFTVLENGTFGEIGEFSAIRQKYPDVAQLSAGGNHIFPGLIDSHTHIRNLGMSKFQVELFDTTSVTEAVSRISDFIIENNLPPGSFIRGRGWDQTLWNPATFPTKADLDLIDGDHYIWLRRVDGHAGWANSRAVLAAAPSFPPNDTNPEGGTIIRNTTTLDPTGIFIDTAMTFIDSIFPPATEAEERTALHLAAQECFRFGITQVHDAGMAPQTISLIKTLIDEKVWNLRVYAMVSSSGDGGEADNFNSTLNTFCAKEKLHMYGNGLLTARAVKMVQDGALGSRGAAMIEAYSDEPGYFGLTMRSQEALNELVLGWVECGYQVGVHAIGDRANEMVLDSFENVADHGFDVPSLRFRVEHAQIVDGDQMIERFKEMNILASMQPAHMMTDMRFAEDRIGDERIKFAYAWKSFLNASVHLPFGSDVPVEPIDPRRGLHAAVTRQDEEGLPVGGWYPLQRVSRQEALFGFTHAGAHASFQEDYVGSIKAGKYADWIVVDGDILDNDVHLPDLQFLQTWVGGEFVYGTDHF